MSIDSYVTVIDGNRVTLTDRSSLKPSYHTSENLPDNIHRIQGLKVWGGCSEVILGDVKIADRTGPRRLRFMDPETINRAVSEYRQDA